MNMNKTDEFSFVLKSSTITGGGVGVFAIHNIDEGTKLELMPDGGENRTLDKEVVPEPLRHFCIINPDGTRKCPMAFNHLWIVWYLNHSAEPNIYLDTKALIYYAKRDIVAGEELLTDYNEFEEPEELKEDYYKKN